MITDYSGPKGLEQVLKLIELTQRGSLIWYFPEVTRGLIEDAMKPEELAERMGLAAQDERARGYIIESFYRALLERVSDQLGFRAQYDDCWLRLYRGTGEEGTSRWRAKLDVEDNAGRILGSFAQSPALDDLLATVERLARANPSSPTEGASSTTR